MTDRWQLVARAHAAVSLGGDGLLPAVRYERMAGSSLTALAPDGTGNRAISGSLGANYYLHGHGLKMMVAIERASLAGGSGGGGSNRWAFLSGIRAFL